MKEYDRSNGFTCEILNEISGIFIGNILGGAILMICEYDGSFGKEVDKEAGKEVGVD